jgi:dinuclear metal center YbgI/SA1388 family protein
VKIQKVIDALEQFAPLPLQEDYDNAGLQVGLTEAEVSGALLCLDVTEDIVDEAIRRHCNLIVAHHPLIFRKLSHLTGATYVERTVVKAVKNDIVIVAMHTNLDNARGGVNHMMAEKMHLCDVRFLTPSRTIDGVEGASGVVGQLPEAMPACDFIDMLKKTFGVVCVQTNEELQRPIRSVALCGGAGAFLLEDAIDSGADAFVTGEMHYHDFFGHEGEIQIAVIGHYQSEQYTIELLRDIIQRQCPEVRCLTTEINTNPIRYR